MDGARKPNLTSNIAPVSANHEWILDVISDLQAYAQQNKLTKVQASAINMLAVARRDIIGDAEGNGTLVMAFDSAPRSNN